MDQKRSTHHDDRNARREHVAFFRIYIYIRIKRRSQKSVPIGAEFPFLVIHLTFLSFSTLFLIEFAEDLSRRRVDFKSKSDPPDRLPFFEHARGKDLSIISKGYRIKF